LPRPIPQSPTIRVPSSTASIRYDFVRDGAQWKIDDIRGAEDSKPWSIREMLNESLKN
jgi:hypothetical protein